MHAKNIFISNDINTATLSVLHLLFLIINTIKPLIHIVNLMAFIM